MIFQMTINGKHQFGVFTYVFSIIYSAQTAIKNCNSIIKNVPVGVIFELIKCCHHFYTPSLERVVEGLGTCRYLVTVIMTEKQMCQESAIETAALLCLSTFTFFCLCDASGKLTLNNSHRC